MRYWPMKKNSALFTSNKLDWETPDELFRYLNKIFRFEIDLAANRENAKCQRFIGEEMDSLAIDWGAFRGQTCWLNPPYGKNLGSWMHKCVEAKNKGVTVVALVPVRSDTIWWNVSVKGHAVVLPIQGRIKFKGGASCAPFPSCIVIYFGKDASCRF